MSVGTLRDQVKKISFESHKAQAFKQHNINTYFTLQLIETGLLLLI